MDSINRIYNGKSWKSSSTMTDKNSFFHATFGTRANVDEPYLDKRVKFRRSRWSTFLNYFEGEVMPPPLANVLTKCLSANPAYNHSSIEDQDHLESYILDITKAKHDVTMEEIPILATLDNVKVVLFKDEASEPTVIISPDNQILGSYQNMEKPKGEVVLHVEGNVFSRMDPLVKDSVPESIGNEDTITDVEAIEESVDESSIGLVRYKKGGCAGGKGLQYQVGLLTIFFLNALQKLTNWKLSTENKAAGKFDDVVLECRGGATLLQAKHKHKKTKKISFEELVSTNSKNDDFSVPKYFLSYEKIKKMFKTKEVIICTNAGVTDKVIKYLEAHTVQSESMLHYKNCDCKFYTFTDAILPDLKENIKSYYKKNFQNKEVDESIITDENIKDFLRHLQLFFNYPPGNNVGKVVEQLLSQMKSSRNVYGHLSFSEIYAKMLDWFQQEDGIYITELYGKVIFSEIWRDNHWQRLEKYEISFLSNNLNFQSSKKLFHVSVEGLLQEIKIFQTLQSNKTKFLFVNLNDGSEKQKQVIDAFCLPQHTILVLVCPKVTEANIIKEVSNKLKTILEKFDYKKVVLVADSNNKIPQLTGLSDANFDIITECMTLGDLSKGTRERLLENESIIFQGNDISLKKLFSRQETEDYTKFLNSEELEKLVTGEKIKVGARVVELDQYLAQFYIQRKFKKGIKNNKDKKAKSATREVFSEEEICEMKDKVLLISDSAGTGKSTVLTNLAVTMKKKYPHLWIIRIDLNDYTQILKDFLEKNRKSISVLELLNSKDSTKLTTQLERAVFSMDEKVVLMLDGFDEISPDYTELVLSLLSLSCEQHFEKVIVTTRPHMARELEITLQVEPFILEPFTEQNQIDVLAGFWILNLEVDNTERGKCEEYAKVLIEKMSSWVRLFEQGTNHFAAIPLHVLMLAEIFQENNQSEMSNDWKGCKEYLATGGVEPRLPENMNVTSLYKMFIKKKQSVFINKENPSGKTAANRALIEQFEECLAYHRSLALKLILDKTKCELFLCPRQTTKDLETNIVKMGIVQKVDNEFHFAHRTFAEYFVAQSLVEELQLPNENVEFQKFLIEEIILSSQFDVIHVFFNSFLHQVIDKLFPNTIYKYQITAFDAHKFDLLNRIVENGHLAIFQLILKCVDLNITRKRPQSALLFFEAPTETNIPNYSNILNVVQQKAFDVKYTIDTFLEHAARGGDLKTVKFLVEQGAKINVRSLRSLHNAVRTGHLEVAKFLIEQGADIRGKDSYHRTTVMYKAISKNDTAMAAYLLDSMLQSEGLNIYDPIIPYMASYLGRLDILEMLTGRGLNVNGRVENGETAIFGAARGGQIETIKYLLRQGYDINGRDYENNTILHVISREPSLLSTAEWLVDKIDVNAKNVGFTALHLAVESNNFNLVNLLVNNGANVNLAGQNGTTALHFAVEGNNFDLVQLLVDREAYVDLADKQGVTPLHIAVEENNYGLTELLVNHGAHVNLADQEGVAALHIAVKESNYDLIELLMKRGALVNLADRKGVTALHIATKEKNNNLVELLINHGACVNLADKKCVTAVHIAVKEKNFNLVELLVNCGASVNLPDQAGVTALHTAVKRKNIDLVKLLINGGAHINLTDQEGVVALHTAVKGKNIDLVKLLINYGAHVNLADREGMTALHIAAKENNYDLIELLVNHGAYINLADREGMTPLHTAVKENHFDLTELLVNSGANVNLADIKGMTPLHTVVKEKTIDLVELLVNRGANVNLADREGMTALHIAVKENNYDLIELLVNHGAYINLADREGMTPLHTAVKENHFDLAELLVNSGANVNLADCKGVTPLHTATKENHFYLVELLVNSGANVNLTDQKGVTALQVAVRENNFKLIVLLANCNANVNLADQEGTTALHIAVEEENYDLVELLLNFGANVNLADQKGATALHTALEKNNFKLVRLLVNYKADVNLVDVEGNTTLHLAATKSFRVNILEFLLRHGANINVKNKYGFTAIYLATKQCCLHFKDVHIQSAQNINLIKFLIENGGDINIKNTDGNTLLHLAAKMGQLDIIALLVESRANIDIIDNDGQTAIHLAALRGYTHIVKFLVQHNADSNIKNDDGNTVLHYLVNYTSRDKDRHDVLRLVIENCRDVNLKTNGGCTTLHLATIVGDLNAVMLLVETGVDVNIKDAEGRTALHLAAREGHFNVVQCLLQGDADVTIRDNVGYTVLHYAAKSKFDDLLVLRRNDEDTSDCPTQNFINHDNRADGGTRNNDEETTLRFLDLEARAKVYLDIIETMVVKCSKVIDIEDKTGCTALHLAVLEGNLQFFKLLVRHGADVNSRNVDGCTALHIAASKGHVDIVKFLLECSVGVEIRDNDSRTPLHLAVEKHALDVVVVLVDSGVDVNARDETGNTALHTAVTSGNFDSAEYLVKADIDIGIRNNRGYTPLHLAVLEGDLKVVDMLVKHKANVTIKDNIDRTALQVAVDGGKMDIAKLLLEYTTLHGSDIDWVISGENHRTALHLTAERGDLDTVIFFVDLGIDVNVTNDEGHTPLQLALDGGHLGVIKYLVERGADVTRIENYEFLVLYLAAKSRDLDMMTFFVDRCTSVNVTDKDGNTALHSAVDTNALDVVKILVDFGTDLNVKNNEGQTALHLASNKGYLDIASFLIQQGADLNVTDNSGSSALHLATCSGLDLVTILVEGGADIYLEDSNGDTAAIAAKRSGYVDVFKYLQKEISLKNRLFR